EEEDTCLRKRGDRSKVSGRQNLALDLRGPVVDLPPQACQLGRELGEILQVLDRELARSLQRLPGATAVLRAHRSEVVLEGIEREVHHTRGWNRYTGKSKTRQLLASRGVAGSEVLYECELGSAPQRFLERGRD